MALFGSIATVEKQVGDAEKFAAAFAYLRELTAADSAGAQRLRGLSAGESEKIELTGGAFAIEQVYFTKDRPEGFFESHRKFIDVQVVVEGNECMEVVELSRATARQDYDGERDLLVYTDVVGASRLQLVAGEAAVFFPVDVHMPCLHGNAGRQLVRKTVVKVPV